MSVWNSSLKPVRWCWLVLGGAWLTLAISTPGMGAVSIPQGPDGFNASVKPFFEQYCVGCHGPKKSKGKMILHTLDGNIAAGKEMERWAHILENLENGEMPPEDEKQPDAATRLAIAAWVKEGIRTQLAKSQTQNAAPSARRLTNFEYQNTLRDLLGVDVKVSDLLLPDPIKPYRFNNTAEMMGVGPEQMDRYLAAARRILASTIVDPAPPEIHKTRFEWKRGDNFGDIGSDEVSPWGNDGLSVNLKSFPKTGEFRIRIKASTILPKGVSSVPMRVVLGYNLNENSSSHQIAEVGMREISNNTDHPETYEFRGRIENFPPRPGQKSGDTQKPDVFTVTVQNAFNDGSLNDEDAYLYWPRRATGSRLVLESLEFEAPLAEVWPPAPHRQILFDSPLRQSDVRGYVREVLAQFLPRAFRRPVSSEEVEKFVKVYDILAPDMKSFEAAMRETLAMVLISSKFLYHAESSNDPSVAQHQFASKLSYFLWGSMPDTELFELAAKGQLADEKVTGQQVRRLLADPRSKDFLHNFTLQWLSIEKMKTVPINKDHFPRFIYYVPIGERAGTEMPYRPTLRDYMIEETVGFVGEVIRRNASAMDFVDSKFAFLNEPLASHYGIKGVQGIALRAVEVKPEDRLGGLLTQGSVLIGNGTGSAPHPIYRAVWLREAILGDEVAPPPAEVPALSDSAGASLEHAVTIKDLLALHRKQESCNDCHARLDPWGIPFEHYNAIGQYQPVVPQPKVRVRGFDRSKDKDLAGYKAYLASLNTEKIEASAKIPHGPAVNNLDELKAYLLKDRKDEIGGNVLRQLLQYGIGRHLTYHDSLALEPMLAAAKQNDFKVQDMIVAICNSNFFRNRLPQALTKNSR